MIAFLDVAQVGPFDYLPAHAHADTSSPRPKKFEGK